MKNKKQIKNRKGDGGTWLIGLLMTVITLIAALVAINLLVQASGAHLLFQDRFQEIDAPDSKDSTVFCPTNMMVYGGFVQAFKKGHWYTFGLIKDFDYLAQTKFYCSRPPTGAFVYLDVDRYIGVARVISDKSGVDSDDYYYCNTYLDRTDDHGDLWCDPGYVVCGGKTSDEKVFNALRCCPATGILIDTVSPPTRFGTGCGSNVDEADMICESGTVMCGAKNVRLYESRLDSIWCCKYVSGSSAPRTSFLPFEGDVIDIAVGDFDGSGRAEIAVLVNTDAGNRIFIVQNPLRPRLEELIGLGTRAEGITEIVPRFVIPTPNTVAITAGDFNNDGKDELAFLHKDPGSGDGYIYWFEDPLSPDRECCHLQDSDSSDCTAPSCKDPEGLHFSLLINPHHNFISGNFDGEGGDDLAVLIEDSSVNNLVTFILDLYNTNGPDTTNSVSGDDGYSSEKISLISSLSLSGGASSGLLYNCDDQKIYYIPYPTTYGSDSPNPFTFNGFEGSTKMLSSADLRGNSYDSPVFLTESSEGSKTAWVFEDDPFYSADPKKALRFYDRDGHDGEITLIETGDFVGYGQEGIVLKSKWRGNSMLIVYSRLSSMQNMLVGEYVSECDVTSCDTNIQVEDDYDITESTITIAFEVPSSGSITPAYEFYYREYDEYDEYDWVLAETTVLVGDQGETVTYTFQNLDSGTPYNLRIDSVLCEETVCRTQETFEDQGVYTTRCDLSSFDVTLLEVNEDGTYKVNFNWDECSVADSYTVGYCINWEDCTDLFSGQSSNLCEDSFCSWTTSVPESSDNFNFKLTAMKGNNEIGVEWKTVNFEKCTEGFPLDASEITDSSVVITWDECLLEGYHEVWHQSEATDWDYIKHGTTSSALPPYEADELESDTEYSFRLLVYDEDEEFVTKSEWLEVTTEN